MEDDKFKKFTVIENGEKTSIKNHQQLDKYLLENGELMNDDEKFFLKSDRSFWLNEFCLAKKLHGKRKLLSEYETKLENYLWDDNKTLKKRIETTLKQEFFYNPKFSETKENLQNMKKLKKFHEIYDEKIDSDKQFK